MSHIRTSVSYHAVWIIEEDFLFHASVGHVGRDTVYIQGVPSKVVGQFTYVFPKVRFVLKYV